MKKKKNDWLKNPQSHWTPKQRKALFAALKKGGTILYYNSDQSGRPANGGSGTVCAPGAIHETQKASICSTGLHATYEPHRWAGYRCWVVALFGEIEARDDKRCSAKREIIGEILPNEAVVYASVRAALRGNLSRANLTRAHLTGAHLTRADLSRADLSRANLSRADLSGANLSRANLSGAHLSWASPLTVARLVEYGWDIDADGYAERKK